MDAWEHAFLLDYAPAERPRYVEAFFSNLHWSAVEERLGTLRRRGRAEPPLIVVVFVADCIKYLAVCGETSRINPAWRILAVVPLLQRARRTTTASSRPSPE